MGFLLEALKGVRIRRVSAKGGALNNFPFLNSWVHACLR